jgi:hypothetical protein
MNIVTTVQNATTLAATSHEAAWAVAAVVVPDADEAHLESLERYDVRLRPDTTVEAWRRAFLATKSTLALVTSDGGPVTLAQAPRISRPTLTWRNGPVAAWIEKFGATRRLMLWEQGETHCLHETQQVIRHPAITKHGDSILIAYSLDVGSETVAVVCDEEGREIHRASGRNPVFAGGDSEQAALITEQFLEGQARLHLHLYTNGEHASSIPMPLVDDMNLHPSARWHDGILWFAWEACPAFGANEYAGGHRDLTSWLFDPEVGAFTPAPGTANGLLPLPRKAFFDTYSDFALAPLQPFLAFVDGQPWVAYRRFRYYGAKSSAWDTYTIAFDGTAWSTPRRLTQNAGSPDMGHSLMQVKDKLLVVSTAWDHEPSLDFESIQAGLRPGQWHALSNFRTEIVEMALDESLPEPDFPDRQVGSYVIAHSTRDAAPTPPALPSPPEGLQLLWGETHSHTSYSKCMSANNGIPSDVLRLQRDNLGCDVICLTDHVEGMRAPEALHVFDVLEDEAGDRCHILYGMEWGMKPAHHTNFYTIDRKTFEHLRIILLAETHLAPIFKRIHDELPEGSVLPVRHFHGVSDPGTGISGEDFDATFDPTLEFTMEAMQTRGNVMTDGHKHFDLFPNNFLNRGHKVGLIGGSDHSRCWGPNHFCLTGFWVRELTSQAVFEAMKQRRTLAMSNGKIAMWATLNGKPVGSEVTTEGPVRIQVDIACACPIERITLMRDGELLPWQEVNAPTARVELVDDSPEPGDHWYVVTAEAETSFGRQKVLAHASPFFVRVT